MTTLHKIKNYFLKIYPKPFIIVCAVIMIAGIGYALYVAGNNIDLKIIQRESELKQDFEIQQKIEAETIAINKKAAEEGRIYRGRFYQPSYEPQLVSFNDFRNTDFEYQKLQKTKQTPFITLAMNNLWLFWFGVFMLVGVLVFNLIVLAIKYSHTQAKIINVNLKNMSPFQRYLLLIALGVLIALVYVFSKVR